MPFGKMAVMNLTGLSRMQLDHWSHIGIIRPSVKSASGKGTRKEYSFQDLIQLRLAKKLRDEGIHLNRIRNVLTYFRKNLKLMNENEIRISDWIPNEELRYFTNGIDIFVITQDPQDTWNVLKNKFILSLPLGDIIKELRDDLKQLSDPKEEAIKVKGRDFTIIFTPDLEDGGYTIQCKEIPAAISQGDTEQEALDNIFDAIELCLETESDLQKKKFQVL